MCFRKTPFQRFVWSALLALIIVTAGCTADSPAVRTQSAQEPQTSQEAPSLTKDEPIAEIGGKTIMRSELTERLLRLHGAEALREIMLREAVNLEASRLGVRVSANELEREIRRMSEGYESENEFFSAMMQQLGMDRSEVWEEAEHRLLLEKLATLDVDIAEEEIRQYYEDRSDQYGPRTQFRLAWVLTETEEDAGAVLSRLEAGTDFSELALEYSLDEMTSENGGDLGWLEAGDPFIDPRVLTAAEGLQIGEAAGPLKVADGYAVLQLNGKKSTGRQEYGDVREDIRRLLAMEQAGPVSELERALLVRHGAKVLDSRLSR